MPVLLPVTDASFARLAAAAYGPESSDTGSAHALRAGNVVAFRGTVPDSLADWLRDFDVLPVNDPDIGWAHQGFLEGAESALQFVGADPVALTGHSLGGALAVVVAAKLIARGVQVTSVVTFGAPHAVGYRARTLLSGSTTQVRQYRRGLDIVPCVPWEPGLLAHVAPLTHIGRPSGNPLEDHAIARYCTDLEAA